MGKRDLISKDFALYVVHYFASMQTWSKEDILAEIDSKIKEANEDVVRCKDCKHRETSECPMVFYENLHWDDNGYIECETIIHDNAEDDGFCSYGERKEQE